MQLSTVTTTRFIVEKTNDPSIFKKLANREYSASHASKIARSMKKRTVFSPIYVNDAMGVIDGQHRLAAFSQQEDPEIYYIRLHGLNYDSTVIPYYNTNSDNWKTQTLIDSYVKLGKTGFVVLESFRQYCDDTLGKKLSLGNVLILLTGSGSLRTVKDGTLSVNLAELGKAKLNVQTLALYTKAAVDREDCLCWNAPNFIRALTKSAPLDPAIIKQALSNPGNRKAMGRLKNAEGNEAKISEYTELINDLYEAGVKNLRMSR